MTSKVLCIIDPQNDFCTSGGALFVPGSEADITRICRVVREVDFASIVVTMDSHGSYGIERPSWWAREDGAAVQPFTTLTLVGGQIQDTEGNRYRARFPESQGHSVEYLQALAASGKYAHMIWPTHCVTGSWGWSLPPELRSALNDWERRTGRATQFVLKGTSPNTEHFSAIAPEVGTSDFNMAFLPRRDDEWVVCGEAQSHCVAATMRDLLSLGSPGHGVTYTLLADAMSNVPGFEAVGAAFLQEMVAAGVRLSTTKTLLGQE